MNPLRVYIVIPTFLPIVGGSEKQALAHGRGLQERGLVTTIVTFRYQRQWLPCDVVESVPTLRVAGRLLGGREKLPRLLQKLLYLMALPVMAWTLWRHRHHYDVIHLHQLGMLAFPVALVCWMTGKPLVVSVRAAGSGKTSGSSGKALLLAGPLDPKTPWLQFNGRTQIAGDLEGLERLGKPIARLTHALLRHISAVLVILSVQTRAYLAAHDFLLPDTRLIPNGVDLTRFTPIDEGTFGQQPAIVVVCVARLDYQKGIDVLLQAWRLVQREVPQGRLIIVGSGPLQAQLELLAQALHIQHSIEFAGLQHDVPAQLHQGSLAVLPSRCEGMSNAILEAMACGLPCVATRVSGCEDLIQHGVNGLLVASEDYQGMAQALLTLLRDPLLARTYGQAARATVERHYARERVIDQYVNLYQTIVSRRLQNSEVAPVSPIFPERS